MSTDKTIITVKGVVKYSHLNKPDTKYNKEGIYSVTLAELSDAAKVRLGQEGIKGKADGNYKFSSKYKPQIVLDKETGEELDESVMIGQGTTVEVSGVVFKAEGKDPTLKMFKVTIVDLIEYVPDGGLEAL